MNGKSRRFILPAVCIICPVFIALLYILVFGRSLVFWDEWELVGLLEKVFNGTLNWSDMFAQHNEHRMVFPKLLMIGLSLVTQFNTLVEMYISWFILIVILLVFFYIYRGSLTGPAPSLSFFIPVAWLLFSLRQWDNLLFGFQLCYYLAVLGVVCAVFFLWKSRGFDKYFLGSLCAAVVGSFSVANGLVVWPVGLILSLIQKKEKKMLIVWCVSAGIIFLTYFQNWKRAGGLPTVSYLTGNPFTSAEYFIAYLGSPLGVGPWGPVFIAYSTLVGLILLVFLGTATYFSVKYSLVEECSPWFALILFWLISAGITAAGRGGLGVEQALSSRYVTFGLPGIIGLYLMFLIIHIKNSGSNLVRWSWNVFLAVVIIGLFLGLLEGAVMGIKISGERDAMRCTLSDYHHATDDQLKDLYPNPEIVRKQAGILEKHHFNVFSSEEKFNLMQPACSSVPRNQSLFSNLLAYRDYVNTVLPP